ncbi:MAG: TIGR01244 family sulfur transferase [Neisseria sp.]|nr:TIGR01244 family sulfur transferase [Neisseria sp.]
MTIRRLSDTLYIAPQLDEASIAQAAALGIKSVICNRPDEEENGQTSAGQIKQKLAAHGITAFAHQPVTAPNVTATDAAEFARLTAQQPAPVLAYCRTGTRCTLLWALQAVADGMSAADALAAAEQIGINLNPFADKLAAAEKA